MATADLRAQAKAVKLVSGGTGAAMALRAALGRGLMDQGRRVLMVGDGLNVTAALTTAHVSISPAQAQALDAVRVVSDIVLLGRDVAAL